MTWFYERDQNNNRIRLRFESDSGEVFGPVDVPWSDAPNLTTSPDGWVTDPDVKVEAGRATTDLYADVGVETALMGLRDLAAGNVEEEQP